MVAKLSYSNFCPYTVAYLRLDGHTHRHVCAHKHTRRHTQIDPRYSNRESEMSQRNRKPTGSNNYNHRAESHVHDDMLAQLRHENEKSKLYRPN